MLRAIAPFVLVVVLSGCSPQGDSMNEVTDHENRAQEAQSADSEITVQASPPIPFEGGTVLLPFKYVTVFDRTRETEKFALQRRMFVELIGGDIAGRSHELQHAMEAEGFIPEYIRESDGVIQGKFSKDGAYSIYTLIRPPGVGPSIHEDGAIASLLMTQVLEEH